MKVFEFNPATGRKGEFLYHKRVARWSDCSVEFAVANGKIEPINFTPPKNYGNANYTVHVDGGNEWPANNFISYREPDRWVMFCIGKIVDGPWEWMVLPPENLVKEIEK